MFDIFIHSVMVLIGIGESDHGTKEIQVLRLKLIKKYYKKYFKYFVLLIEDNYVSWIDIDGYKPESYDDLTKFIKTQNIFSFYKSKEFIDIIWWCKKKNISIFGVDVQEYYTKNSPKKTIPIYINNILQESTPKLQKMLPKCMKTFKWNKYQEIRDNAMKKIMKYFLKKYKNGAFLAHNYHVPLSNANTKIGIWCNKGTVRVKDKKTFIPFHKKYDTHLNIKKTLILHKKKKI